MSARRAIVLLPLVLILGGCASAPHSVCRSGESLEVQDTLYFGNNTPTGVVAPADWAAFLAATVTPRFPKGLTVFDAYGQWGGPTGAVVKEQSRVLNLVHPDDGLAEVPLAEIIAAYKAQFQQDSVLRVSVDACVSL